METAVPADVLSCRFFAATLVSRDPAHAPGPVRTSQRFGPDLLPGARERLNRHRCQMTNSRAPKSADNSAQPPIVCRQVAPLLPQGRTPRFRRRGRLRLNLVNQRREFFYATPSEVRDLLTQADGSVLEFVEEPEADEWHQSENSRRNAGIVAPGLVAASVTGAAVEPPPVAPGSPPPPSHPNP